MASVQQSGASALLMRAVQCDNEGLYDEALTCYQTGIEQLLQVIKESIDEQVRTSLKSRVKEYMDRAEKIKEVLRKKKEDEKHHEQIRFEENSTGHSYDEIFGRFLDEMLTEVEMEDSYIRSPHQIYNFIRFCEMLLLSAARVKSIYLKTGYDDQNDSKSQQRSQLAEVTESLKRHGVTLHVTFSSTLHDREIRFNNGWVIQIGRGLDVFKNPGKFCIGFCEMRLRRCYETTINIFRRPYVRTLTPPGGNVT